MSLYAALYAGVSGMSATASAIAGVSDNITNINTIGYKGVSTEFKTLVADGKARNTYAAGGVAAAPKQLLTKQGLLQSSSSQTDLGIDGSGFFVTRNSSDNDAPVSFTRAGSFQPDTQGFLRNSGGYYLQGWRLDATGSYVNTGNLGELESVRLSDLTGTAAPTTRMQLRMNLDSTQDVFAGAYTAGEMADGTVTPHFTRVFDIYDAQGNSHRIHMSYLKTDTNEWQGEIYAVPASDVSAADGLLSSGTIMFNPDGSLDRAASSAAFFNPVTPGWTNGAASVPINLAIGTDDGIDGLTQFGSQSALLSTTVDGGPLGNITSIEVTDRGLVSAVFDDGTIRAVFQLPLATFPNPNSLTRLPGNAYALSNISGNASINEPGSFGSGKVLANTLEASNVDLAEEFTSMIRFQRAYSASSKIITTVDEMLSEVANLKR